MTATFLDHESLDNPLNGSVVDRGSALQVLRSLQGRTPFFCSLESEVGTLIVGIGKDFGCVQFTPSEGGPPYLMAVTTAPEEDEGYVEFLSGGTPSPVAKRFILPWDLVERIVAHFLEHCAVPRDVRWEDI